MTSSLPHNREQITDSSGRATMPFRRFLEGIASRADVEAATAAQTAITGSGSVEVSEDGQARLDNDENSPGDSRYYGTNTSGVKGWFSRLLSTLADVDLSTPAEAGDALVYDGTAWVAGAAATSFEVSLDGGEINVTYDDYSDGQLTHADTYDAGTIA